MHICYIFLLISLFCSFNIYAQEEYVEFSPWEPDDIKPIYSSYSVIHDIKRDPLTILSFNAIKFYQKKISTKSISRCPFYISCSNYAYLAIEKYGLLIGICYFIDRNFYRENIACFYHYELRENKEGILKLDDSFFLLGVKNK
ncbi:membrane protein insertion efficiency factor YidD [bacterium]|nr:membrane protein insertion efficiency factor YidD [bacterium]